MYIKNNKIAIWLFICTFLVFAMVIVGGLTRLTDSGLSIVSWKPVHGTLPPINQTQWDEEFESYRLTPEYQKKNLGMSLPEFKHIFWWEYCHRLLGRLLGLAFLLPLIYFTLKKQLIIKKSVQLLGIFALGGVQGFIGWWMVSSGLINNPNVSHYRLAAHLLVALLILALLFWQGLNFYLSDEQNPKLKKIIFLSNFLIFAILIQIIFGAFIAGLDAGLTYNTWPLMDNRLIPAGLKFSLHNIEFIQFFHRWWAFAVLGIAVCIILNILKGKYAFPSAKTNLRLKKSARMLLSIIILQIMLGILTLVFVVPVPLASLHQITAVILFGTSIYIRKAIA